MKKLLTFIPLGVGISAAIIYVFNVVQFRVINNSATLMQILSNLRIYLYISIAGFVLYFFIKVLLTLNHHKEPVRETYKKEETEPFYEPIDPYVQQPVTLNETNTYVPNYDYVPVYDKKKHEDIFNNETVKQEVYETTQDDVIKNVEQKLCPKCEEQVSDTDVYCRRCGTRLGTQKPANQTLRNVINVLEIVILILVLYFMVSMMFEYKESKDPNFKSPFKVSMTK